MRDGPYKVLGNVDTAKKLEGWLKRWDAVHLRGEGKPAFSKENPGAKAALLSGPPGIGKSTIATLLPAALGYEVLSSATRTRTCARAAGERRALALALAGGGGDDDVGLAGAGMVGRRWRWRCGGAVVLAG